MTASSTTIECSYAECQYTECHIFISSQYRYAEWVLRLSVVMLRRYAEFRCAECSGTFQTFWPKNLR
jgi:hypothetical protein